MSKRWFALLAAAVVSAGALVAVASPAQAASLGAIALSQTSGTVNDAPMFASGRSSAPCPQGFGANVELRIGRPGAGTFQNLVAAARAGGYDTAPVEMRPNRSFATAVEGQPGEGEWWVVMRCFSLTLGQHPDEFRTSVFVSGATWSTEPPTSGDPTTTTLTITPASPVDAGTEVTLTADIEPDAAAGTVEFKRGSVVIDSVRVSGAEATATLTTTSLPVGTHSVTATFVPADPAAFQGSTSATQSFTVEGELPPGTGQQEIVADIGPGDFTLEVAGDPVRLQGATVGGTATGNLPQVEVTDLRGSNTGWALTGQMADFNTDPVTSPIPAASLAWDPTASRTSGTGTVAEGETASLGEARTLCSAAASSSSGVFDCGAGLTLSVPPTTAPGVYRATLTLTLA
jgi:hypothetical protein